MTRLIAITVIAAAITAGCRLKDEASEAGGPIPAPPDVAAPPADALRTSSGLASKMLQVGFGQVKPGPRSLVTVNYVGWTTDGKMFDSGRGVEFPLDRVIPGWTEGLQLMAVGEKRRFWIPGSLAYDNSPDPSDPKGMLVFEVELLLVR